MTIHRLLVAEHRRAAAARVAAGCCRRPRAPRVALPARQLRRPLTSRTRAAACC